MTHTVTFTQLLPDLPATAVFILGVDFLRYFSSAALVYWLVWRVFAKRLAGRRILPNDPKPGQMLREFKHSMTTVTVFAVSGLFIFTMRKLGLTQIYASVDEFGWAWWWASLVLIIVLHDTWFYWTHRLLHRPPWCTLYPCTNLRYSSS